MTWVRERSAARKSRNRKFVPAMTSEDGARLESRALTAPAFWMNPNGGNLTGSSVIGRGVDAIGNQISQTNQVTNGLNGSTASGTLNSATPAVNMPPFFVMPGASFQMTGMASSQVVDYPNPGNGSGFQNVGNFSVSATNAVSLNWGVGQNGNRGPIVNQLAATAAWARSYFMADSLAAPPGMPANTPVTYSSPPVYLHETFQVNFVPPAANSGVNLQPQVNPSRAVFNSGGAAGAGNAGGGVAFDSLVTNVGIGINGPIRFDGVNLSIPQNSTLNFTNPANGNAIRVTSTPTQVRISTSVQIAGLPRATYGDVVAGPVWNVASGATLNGQGAGNPNQVGMTNLNTSYALTFSNFPTTT